MSKLAEPMPLTALHRFTVKQYQRMGEFGILDEDDRVELIDGQIIPMSPVGFEHYKMVNRLTGLLARLAGQEAEISPQNPVIIDRYGMPQPDLALIVPSDSEIARPKDTHLVIEVSDSTLAKDLKLKAKHYARTGVREYWVVDVNAKVLWIHREPRRNGTYASITQLEESETVVCQSFPAVALTRADFGWE